MLELMRTIDDGKESSILSYDIDCQRVASKVNLQHFISIGRGGGREGTLRQARQGPDDPITIPRMLETSVGDVCFFSFLAGNLFKQMMVLLNPLNS